MPSIAFEREEKIKRIEAMSKDGVALEQSFSDLAKTLTAANEALSKGEPPKPETLEQIQVFTGKFNTWHQRAKELLENPTLEQNLYTAQAALAQHKTHLEDTVKREKAMDVLEQVTALSYVGGEELTALTEVQLSAAALRRELKDCPINNSDLVSLISSEHPYCKLLTLVGDPNLPSDTWKTLYDSTSQALSPELAIAAARGRIIIAES